MSKLILVVNPGSVSTKVALYFGEALFAEESVHHDSSFVASHPRVLDQLPMREAAVREWFSFQLRALESSGLPTRLDAVAARGGLLRPLPSGVYKVDDVMLAELRDPETRQHAANLAALIGAGLAAEHHVEAFIVDPVCVDELQDVARVSGLPELPRISLSHALSLKSAARRAADELGKPYAESHLVVVHLGGGISVSAHHNGRMVDVNNANDQGPFSPERVGTLPLSGLAKLFSSAPVEVLRGRFWGGGGLVAHLGTNDAREVEARVTSGDQHAGLVYRAMAYTVAKEIGAMAAALGRKPDAIVLTGGLAHSMMFVEMVSEQVSFMAPILVYPGGDEMNALASGTLRAISRAEQVPAYGQAISGSSAGVEKPQVWVAKAEE